MRSVFTSFSILSVLCVSMQLSAATALDSLVERLQNIETIEGSFVQYMVDQKGSRLQETKGTFKARRPGLFYWATRDPLEQYIYANEERVTIYDPDLEQATVQRVDKQIQATPAILFSGDTQAIGREFTVEQRDYEANTVQYLLTPRAGDSLFERLLIRFEGAQLVEMRLSDSLGQESTVHFVETQMNNPIPVDAFEPELPPGTDVIKDLPVVAPSEADSGDTIPG